MPSACERYSAESLLSGLVTSSSDTGAAGDTVKWKTLSAGSGSVPARTVPLTIGRSTVNCVNETDAVAFAPTFACCVWIWWPSTSSVTGTSDTGSLPLLAMPAETVTRSWPENDARAKVIDGMAMLFALGDATDTGVSV